MLELLQDHTFVTVATGATVLGAASGAVGSFAVLRKQSLMGDAISHATLPGLCIAFILLGDKSSTAFLVGAAIAGGIGMVLMTLIRRMTALKEDAALGIVLSVFFGLGLVLLTMIQKQPNANQSGLETYLFGQAAALLQADVNRIIWVSVASTLCMTLVWKELKLYSFDPNFAVGLGFARNVLEAILIALIVVTVVIGIQTVGVVLMSAMLVAPAACARQWTDRLGIMVVLSAVLGGTSGFVGTLGSSLKSNVPTGPVIVLFMGAVVAFSMTMGSRRGLLWQAMRQRMASRSLRERAVLLDLYELSRQHKSIEHSHSVDVLLTMNQDSDRIRIESSLSKLANQGWAAHTENQWHITQVGAQEARATMKRYGLAELQTVGESVSGGSV